MDAQLLVLFPLIRCFSSSVVYVWQCSISACSLEVVCSLDQIHKSLFSWNSHFQSSYYWLNSDETTVFFKICIFFLQSDVFKFPFSFWEGWLGLSEELFCLSSSFDHMHCLYQAISITRMSFFMAFFRPSWAVLGFDTHESLSKICLFLSMVARLVSNFDFFDYKKSKLEYL